MRVLQIGASSVKGGIESFLINYNRELVKYGIYFDYISDNDILAYENDIIELKGIIYKGISRGNPLTYFKKLLNVTKKYDVVHINMLSAANILPLIACRLSGVKRIIVHSHNAGTEKWYRYALHYINKWMIPLLATDYWACSDLAAKWLYPMNAYKNKKYIFIKNAIRYDDYKFSKEFRAKVRKKLMLDDDVILIGNVGRVTKQKNIIFLLKIIKTLLNYNPKIKLVHIGAYENDYKNIVSNKIQELNLKDNVMFIDEISNVSEYYSAFDYFCMPSLYEGLSFTAVEAQCSGVKCIFSSTMTKETDFTGEVIFLPIDSYDVWAENIIKMDRSRINPELIKEKLINSGFEISHESRKYAELLNIKRDECE